MASIIDVSRDDQQKTRFEDNLPTRDGSGTAGPSGRESHSLNHPTQPPTSSSNEGPDDNDKHSEHSQGSSPSNSTGADGSSPATSPTSSTTRSETGNQDDYEGLDPHVYPPQKHAGKVWYGPHFSEGTGFWDKMGGYKETLIGKITHDHAKVEHGHDRKTGELKQKELDGNMDPFQESDKSSDTSPADKPNAAKRVGSAKGDKEQAATVAPEGTEPEEHRGQL